MTIKPQSVSTFSLKKIISAMAILLVVIPSLAFAAGDGIYEAVSFGVRYYGGSGECAGDDVVRVYENNNTYVWRWNNTLGQYGYTLKEHRNKSVDRWDWVNGSNTSPTGTDWADVVLFRGHGFRNCNEPNSGYYTGIVMGDCTNDGRSSCEPNSTPCYLHLGDAKLGGTDANALVTVACHTLQKCAIDRNYPTNLRESSQLNLINGYHGQHWQSEADVLNHFKWFMIYSEENNMGAEWVDKLTNYDAHNDYDNCAVAYAMGADYEQTLQVYYNQGFKDFKSTGWGFRSYWYVEGCDPSKGEKL